MKQKKQEEQVEIHKAVAQAWHGHFTNEKIATSEFDARRRNFQIKPSRFKLETMNKLKIEEEAKRAKWDFNHSLWDPYEIVAISKRLETGLLLNHYDDLDDLHKLDENRRLFKRRKESKNSLRSLFNIMSSRRFNDVQISHHQ